MKLTTNTLVDFLQSHGWENKGQDNKFIYFVPPKQMNIPGVFVPIPRMQSAPDYGDALRHASRILEQIYETDISELLFEAGNFQSTMLQNAIYVKLFTSDRSDHSLEVTHVTSFLKNLNTSFEGYLKVEFARRFASQIRDNLEKAATKLILLSRLRFIDLQFQSFSFGVSMDPTIGRSEFGLRGMNNWRDKVLPHYEEDVLTQDFSDHNTIEEIKDKYDEIERKVIFDPLFKAINNNEYKVALTNQSYQPKKRIKTVTRARVKEIVPNISTNEPDKTLSFVQVILPVTSSGDLGIRSPKKAIASGGLFAKQVKRIPIQQIFRNDEVLEFAKPIEVILDSTPEGEYILRSIEAEIEVKNATFEGVQKTFNDLLWRIYDTIGEGKNISYLLLD